MKLFSFRTVSVLATTVLLTACGAGQQDAQAPMQLASVVVSSSAAQASTGAPVAPSVSANMPAPDCAAEGCGSLRIIDGNAEAWRVDAQRRAAMDAALPQS